MTEPGLSYNPGLLTSLFSPLGPVASSHFTYSYPRLPSELYIVRLLSSFRGPESGRVNRPVKRHEALCENGLQLSPAGCVRPESPSELPSHPHLSLSLQCLLLRVFPSKKHLFPLSWSWLRLRRILPPKKLLHGLLFPPSGHLASGGGIISCAHLSQVCLFPLYQCPCLFFPFSPFSFSFFLTFFVFIFSLPSPPRPHASF